MRTIQGWETGAMYPSDVRLQSLIAPLLEAHGLPAGREADEAEALWEAVLRDSTRGHSPFDRRWFATLPTPDRASNTDLHQQPPPLRELHPAVLERQRDCRGRLYRSCQRTFDGQRLGRARHCRLIGVLGMAALARPVSPPGLPRM
jgi:hypothetical protein